MHLTFKQALNSEIITKENLENYYKDHTLEQCEDYFNIGNKVITKLFLHYDIKKRTAKECKAFNDSNLSILYDSKWESIKDDIINYYETHSGLECAEYFKIGSKHTFYKICRLLGIKIKSASECQKVAVNTKYNKYGYIPYGESLFSHYCYDNISFDSSWELALYIYAKDHNETIKREPCRFVYYVDNHIHHYYPDFLYKDWLIEIKNDTAINSDGVILDFRTGEKLIDKTNCIKSNNVLVWSYKDIKFALDYCKLKFNSSNWYLNYKINKNN